MKYAPSEILATPNVEVTKVESKIEKVQISKKANKACFQNEKHLMMREKSAHKLSSEYMATTKLENNRNLSVPKISEIAIKDSAMRDQSRISYQTNALKGKKVNSPKMVKR